MSNIKRKVINLSVFSDISMQQKLSDIVYTPKAFSQENRIFNTRKTGSPYDKIASFDKYLDNPDAICERCGKMLCRYIDVYGLCRMCHKSVKHELMSENKIKSHAHYFKIKYLLRKQSVKTFTIPKSDTSQSYSSIADFIEKKHQLLINNFLTHPDIKNMDTRNDKIEKLYDLSYDEYKKYKNEFAIKEAESIVVDFSRAGLRPRIIDFMN